MFDFVFDLIFYLESYFLKLNVKKIYQIIKGLNKKIFRKWTSNSKDQLQDKQYFYL